MGRDLPRCPGLGPRAPVGPRPRPRKGGRGLDGEVARGLSSGVHVSTPASCAQLLGRSERVGAEQTLTTPRECHCHQPVCQLSAPAWFPPSVVVGSACVPAELVRSGPLCSGSLGPPCSPRGAPGSTQKPPPAVLTGSPQNLPEAQPPVPIETRTLLPRQSRRAGWDCTGHRLLVPGWGSCPPPPASPPPQQPAGPPWVAGCLDRRILSASDAGLCRVQGPGRSANPNQLRPGGPRPGACAP